MKLSVLLPELLPQYDFKLENEQEFSTLGLGAALHGRIILRWKVRQDDPSGGKIFKHLIEADTPKFSRWSIQGLSAG